MAVDESSVYADVLGDRGWDLAALDAGIPRRGRFRTRNDRSVRQRDRA